jgi:hypothetical protein
MEHTAFKIWPVIDRRRQDGGAQQPIRAVGVDEAGSKLYLGLEDGLLEEHTLITEAGAVRASLSARKHVSKKVGTGERLAPRLRLLLLWSVAARAPCVKRGL